MIKDIDRSAFDALAVRESMENAIRPSLLLAGGPHHGRVISSSLRELYLPQRMEAGPIGSAHYIRISHYCGFGRYEPIYVFDNGSGNVNGWHCEGLSGLYDNALATNKDNQLAPLDDLLPAIRHPVWIDCSDLMLSIRPCFRVQTGDGGLQWQWRIRISNEMSLDAKLFAVDDQCILDGLGSDTSGMIILGEFYDQDGKEMSLNDSTIYRKKQ